MIERILEKVGDVRMNDDLQIQPIAQGHASAGSERGAGFDSSAGWSNPIHQPKTGMEGMTREEAERAANEKTAAVIKDMEARRGTSTTTQTEPPATENKPVESKPGTRTGGTLGDALRRRGV